MKQIIIALGFVALAATSATAQVQTHCGVDKGYVCRTNGQSASCYKTSYAQNFPVCMGPNGYYVCCGKDAAKKQEVDDDLAAYPTTEKKTVVCERSGNITSCYEVDRTHTAYIAPVNSD